MMATAMALPNKLLISTPTTSPVGRGHKRTRKSPDDGSPVKRRRQSGAATASAGGVGVVGPISTPLFNGNIREDMFRHYQPWVIQTYGDSAKTKTITLRKYARILRTLRGEETNSVENSKFRFWVKAKGFRVGRPAGYVPKPADAIVGSQTLGGSAHEDPPLYVPTATSKEFDKQMFKKVAVVENFFDIIFSVHVDMEGRAGKHAGQKRTYRAITETYAFLPREAVTRFLLGCTDCQRRPRSPSPAAPAPAASPAPAAPAATPPAEPPFSLPPSLRASATTRRSAGPPEPPEIDFSLPITTTYLKHMRSLGYSDEDALKIDVDDNVSTPEPEMAEEDHFSGRNGDSERDGSAPDEMVWSGYHNALGLKKSSSPLMLGQETASVHDETSSSGNKEDEDDEDDDAEDKIDPQQYDPERLKAFNMFVRLFVDENLDRIIPISKQPKEKIQAIIDSCTRQFPEFAERARKRIRTYLKSCRRNKRSRDGNGAWDATRPTPAHLTSVQAEQILAQACENESHNAKRMRLGLDPVSQPLPLTPQPPEGRPSPPDHYPPTGGEARPAHTPVSTRAGDTPETGLPPSFSPAAANLKASDAVKVMGSSVASAATTTVNGNATTLSSAAPTTVYRPNFSQAFQRVAATGPYAAPLFPAPPFGAGGMMSNGPTDLSMKTKPLLSHKLSTSEILAVRQLITGYRESAAFLLRSADELEQLLQQQ